MRSLTTSVLVRAVAVLVAASAAPGFAGAVEPDVDVRLIPALAPHSYDELPSDDAYLGQRGVQNELSLNPTPNPNYVVEVWVSDVGDVNTGVTSAYFDVSWDNGAINAATEVTQTR